MQACIGLGANLGDAVATVQAALQALDALPRTRLVKASRLYRTPAWGKTDQPAFVNAAALLETALDARTLLDAMLGVERDFGRERADVERWSARTLDLDLLLYGDAVIDEPGLHVPHPHLHERAFALVPLVEIAPDLVIPGHGRASDLVAAMVTGDIHAIG
ncbi:2-amino-4-hydroxy-6-hydroxymethyldihydropteridine diphosphokinase [Lysobacter sp. KIS68-7]|uniref:2-amino-4-hydroxy-6- hydroxymethyldihydropteridine diphosphokinase n=1 Tax=Lysobacter sp. KIS68-7 TaxID=2904252 RepID=UPI001E3B9D0A|nr:2-amino-4-hydroxy-6-hydroxymethyldihydropteridine diphosphokinase [Lysobacter sp. KIS68-7]UHQ18629.1 2-amino-4-hydroxy-6-hydroxymethyldihydropteridine diphosphokinase [Lysobacter sp. KIS68-7]